MARLNVWLHGKPVTQEDLQWLQDKLLFDRVPVADRYVRFVVMLFLSTVIATYGVIADSTATVIGAMIVAPLMTPILAISLSAISGDSRNITRSAITSLGGAALVVGMAYAMSALLPSGIDVAGNSQIAARISPRLLDLIVALAAGAAGAFATGREDVSDALPGVAIAISLVPPLSVVGICLAAGEPRSALGALVLFLTNFLAIIISGMIIFAIMGYSGVARDLPAKAAHRWSVVVIAVATLVILVPLTLTGIRVGQNEVTQRRIGQALDTWLAGTGFEVYSIVADGSKVDVIIAGPGDVPSLDSLQQDLEDKVRQAEVSIKVVPETNLKIEVAP